MNLFYDTEFTERSIQLSAEESYHLQTVLRKKPGDQIFVTNGKGWVFQCRVSDINNKGCKVIVENSTLKPRSEPAIHLCISVLKTSERMEWLIEKATEIGAAGIHFFISARTERRQINLQKLQNTAIAAIKQSGRPWLPEITGPYPYEKYLSGNYQSKFIATLLNSDTPTLKSISSYTANSCILIGPEGDFTEEEVQQALLAGFRAASLGKFTLRAETAGLIAVHTLLDNLTT